MSQNIQNLQAQNDVIGIGVANDLCEPNVVNLVSECHRLGLCQYLTVYVYDNYSMEFLRQIKSQMPATLKYVWHSSGDFELPYDGPSVETNWWRINSIVRLWNPEWITEDVIITNFARTRNQGHPNYVQPFLTEECLDVCVKRMLRLSEVIPVPFYPEVPHFYMPGPDEMHLSTFFKLFVEATGVMLNFDVGHFFSYNLLHKKAPLYRIEEFPLSSVVEMNTAGGMVGDRNGFTWIDDYAGPLNPYTEDVLKDIIPECTNLRAIYTETIGAEPWVLFHNLDRLNRIVPVSFRRQ